MWGRYGCAQAWRFGESVNRKAFAQRENLTAYALFSGRIPIRMVAQRVEHFEDQAANLAEFADAKAARRAGRQSRESFERSGLPERSLRSEHLAYSWVVVSAHILQGHS